MWTTVTHGTRGLGDVGDVRLALLVGSYISVVLWVVGPVVPGAGGPVVSGRSLCSVLCSCRVVGVSIYLYIFSSSLLSAVRYSYVNSCGSAGQIWRVLENAGERWRMLDSAG